MPPLFFGMRNSGNASTQCSLVIRPVSNQSRMMSLIKGLARVLWKWWGASAGRGRAIPSSSCRKMRCPWMVTGFSGGTATEAYLCSLMSAVLGASGYPHDRYRWSPNERCWRRVLWLGSVVYYVGWVSRIPPFTGASASIKAGRAPSSGLSRSSRRNHFDLSRNICLDLVNGKMYAGQGLSKLVAKQNAAESALKALLLEKIAQASEASTKMETNELEGGGAPVEEKKNPPAPGTDNGDTASECEEGSIAEGKPGAPEDEVPWGNLASFALYKLFVEWQQQGTPVPLTKPITQAVTLGPKSNPPAPMKKIPENPTERHPVMLLNQLRPGVVFNELSRVGTPPDVTFTLEVTVDGTSYTGSGKNKKDAKKEAAKAALSGALSINYSTP
uniref:DRBM domain-containing protein n=1 Tax=Timema bartmani TaxID=61472 RepID=A0A7R9I449_9NEOP|nr:unnamed protein product [Timema bartmani]